MQNQCCVAEAWPLTPWPPTSWPRGPHAVALWPPYHGPVAPAPWPPHCGPHTTNMAAAPLVQVPSLPPPSVPPTSKPLPATPGGPPFLPLPHLYPSSCPSLTGVMSQEGGHPPLGGVTTAWATFTTCASELGRLQSGKLNEIHSGEGAEGRELIRWS